jgi:hypothetical protein
MNCLTIAALALRIASIDEDQRFEPGLFVESGCGLEAGVSRRDGEMVADLGLKLRPFGKNWPWIRGGAEADHTRETTYFKRPSRGFVNGGYSVTTIERKWHIRPRLGAGVDVPVASKFFATVEAEATRGGKLLISITRAF